MPAWVKYVLIVLCFAVSPLLAGEKGFSLTTAPSRGDYLAVKLNPYNLGKYLSEAEVNRPELLTEIRDTLAEGNYYRKQTTDQKDRPVRLTVSVNQDYMLRIVTIRNDTCPECKGSGRTNLPFGKITGSIAVAKKCIECNGKGYFPDNLTEKYFILSSEDFENPKEGRRILNEKAYANAPEGAEDYVAMLVSKNPKKRLAACEWLDKNYVRVGGDFQDIMPMLKKARYQEENEKRRIMVWQFWAGKDIPEERDRAFYRIYVNSKNGKIKEKGFYPQK